MQQVKKFVCRRGPEHVVHLKIGNVPGLMIPRSVNARITVAASFLLRRPLCVHSGLIFTISCKNRSSIAVSTNLTSGPVTKNVPDPSRWMLVAVAAAKAR